MRVAILGAECTGKTYLARALSQQLQSDHPGTVWVAEYLREWCETHGRTPHADEQRPIAQVQMERLQAHPKAPIVLSDTAPLMTAVYSDIIFSDSSLYSWAVEQHRAFDLTLVAAPDLPWVADGFQRDGDTRERVDQRLREVLVRYGLGFSVVYGTGEARTQGARQVLQYAMGAPRTGGVGKSWKWNCDKCSDADCEHRMFSGLLSPKTV